MFTDQEINLLLDRLRVEILPRQHGVRGRVPQITRLVSKTLNKTSNTITVYLEFIEPIDTKVDGYKVFCSGLVSDTFVSIGFTKKSPFTLTIPITTMTKKYLIFKIQTVMENGFLSELDLANSITLAV